MSNTGSKTSFRQPINIPQYVKNKKTPDCGSLKFVKLSFQSHYFLALQLLTRKGIQHNGKHISTSKMKITPPFLLRPKKNSSFGSFGMYLKQYFPFKRSSVNFLKETLRSNFKFLNTDFLKWRVFHESLI